MERLPFTCRKAASLSTMSTEGRFRSGDGANRGGPTDGADNTAIPMEVLIVLQLKELEEGYAKLKEAMTAIPQLVAHEVDKALSRSPKRHRIEEDMGSPRSLREPELVNAAWHREGFEKDLRREIKQLRWGSNAAAGSAGGSESWDRGGSGSEGAAVPVSVGFGEKASRSSDSNSRSYKPVLPTDYLIDETMTAGDLLYLWHNPSVFGEDIIPPLKCLTPNNFDLHIKEERTTMAKLRSTLRYVVHKLESLMTSEQLESVTCHRGHGPPPERAVCDQVVSEILAEGAGLKLADARKRGLRKGATELKVRTLYFRFKKLEKSGKSRI